MAKKDTNYISIKESRAILKNNMRQMRYYEKQKRRKLDEKEYTTVMRDENNIIELD